MPEDTPAARIRAWLDADERLAAAATDPDNDWWWDTPEATSPVERHITRHRPARVLATVAALRVVVDVLEDAGDYDDERRHVAHAALTALDRAGAGRPVNHGHPGLPSCATPVGRPADTAGNGAESPAEPRTGVSAGERVPQAGTEALRAVARYTDRLWHTSQHSRCPIWLADRIQDDVNALRTAVGLSEFGWNYWVPDEEVGRCSVHPEGCNGQHTHNPPVRGLVRANDTKEVTDP
jgi:hypothetical protein